MAIDYSRPYASHWRVFKVDPDTWGDAELVGGVSSVSVTRDADGDAPEIDSGSFEVDSGIAFERGYYRVVMTAEQSGEIERTDVVTLLCESEGGTVNRGIDVKDVTGRSVLHPAATTRLLAGEFAPRGGDGAQYAASLLESCIHAPVEVDGSFTLDDNYAFDFGAYALEAVWEILDAGGFCIRLDGAGRVGICPKPTEPSLMLDRANASLLDPAVSYELDCSEVPNRFTATEGGYTAQAVNDSRESETGYPSRGYWIDGFDDSPKRVNGETLDAYAARRLEEESVVKDIRTYSREWWPGVVPFDIVRGSMANVRLDGDMRVVSQDMTLGNGIWVAEKAAMEVRTWQR